MEVPVLNRIAQFEPTPSIISRILSLSSVPPRFLKWGALFLALVYAFGSMAYRIKFLILHFHNKSKSLLSATETLLPSFDDDICASDDDEDDVVSTSSVSSFTADEHEDDGGPTSSGDGLTRFHEDFRVKRKFKIRRCRSIGDDFSLSDLVNGNGVVKLWDGSFLGDLTAISVSPAVFFTAGAGDDGLLGLGLWDFRTGRRKPEVQHEWRSDRRGKVVCRDDVAGMTIGDVRKLCTPLMNLRTTLDEDTWLNPDGREIVG